MVKPAGGGGPLPASSSAWPATFALHRPRSPPASPARGNEGARTTILQRDCPRGSPSVPAVGILDSAGWSVSGSSALVLMRAIVLGGSEFLRRRVLCQAVEDRLVGADKAQQGALHVGDAVTAHEGFPLSPELFEHGFALTHERVPAIRDYQTRSSPVARIRAAKNVGPLPQDRALLRCRLFGDRRAPPPLGDRPGSRRDSTQCEVVGGTDPRVAPRGKTERRLFRHEPE